MRILKLNLIILFLFIIIQPAYSYAEEGACVQLDRLGKVGKYIWKHANDIRGAHYCESRSPVFADLNGNGKEDIAVLYVIEGACYENKLWKPGACSSNYEHFLAVYVNLGFRYNVPIVIKVGGRGIRGIKDISIKDKVIILQTLEYDNDPLCCPSKPGVLKFVLENKKLIQKD